MTQGRTGPFTCTGHENVWCDALNCPGKEIHRRLEAFEELLEALNGLLATEDTKLGHCYWCCEWGEGSECIDPDCPGVKARAAIAKASPQAQ